MSIKFGGHTRERNSQSGIYFWPAEEREIFWRLDTVSAAAKNASRRYKESIVCQKTCCSSFEKTEVINDCLWLASYTQISEFTANLPRFCLHTLYSLATFKTAPGFFSQKCKLKRTKAWAKCLRVASSQCLYPYGMTLSTPNYHAALDIHVRRVAIFNNFVRCRARLSFMAPLCMQCCI